MWHLSAAETLRMAREDRACRVCHRWIPKEDSFVVVSTIVTCGEGFVAVPYRYCVPCAPMRHVPDAVDSRAEGAAEARPGCDGSVECHKESEER